MANSSFPELQDEQFSDPASYKVVSWMSCQELTKEGPRKCMAVIHDDDLDPRLIDLLEHARGLGALSPVKLIAVEEMQLHVFLEGAVSSSCFPTVEALWQQVAEKDRDQLWSWAFSSVSEVLTGHSDYALWAYAKQIVEPLIEAEIPAPKSSPVPDVSPSSPPLDRVYPYLPERVHALLRGAVRKALDLDDRNHLYPSDCESPNGNDESAVPEGNTLNFIRDQCIHLLLDAGVRPQELRRMKVGEDCEVNSKFLKVICHKARNPQRLVKFSREAAELLASYISCSRLSPDHYLFPSHYSVSDKMSQREFRDVLNESRVTSSRTAIDQRSKIKEFQRTLNVNAEIAGWMLGHNSMDVLRHYLPDADGPLITKA